MTLDYISLSISVNIIEPYSEEDWC